MGNWLQTFTQWIYKIDDNDYALMNACEYSPPRHKVALLSGYKNSPEPRKKVYFSPIDEESESEDDDSFDSLNI